MLGDLVLIMLLGCAGYLIWFAWYCRQVEVRTTLARLIDWLEVRRGKLLQEVGDANGNNGYSKKR